MKEGRELATTGWVNGRKKTRTKRGWKNGKHYLEQPLSGNCGEP